MSFGSQKSLISSSLDLYQLAQYFIARLEPILHNTLLIGIINPRLRRIRDHCSKGRRLKNSRSSKRFFEPTSPVDIPDAKDPQKCAEYACDIFDFLIQTETENIANPGYMEKQEDINEKMRAILIDWLVEVHLKFKLVPESLYLTVNLIDRYLEKIASKQTETLISRSYSYAIARNQRDISHVDRSIRYTKEEILSMEREMLQALDFNIQITSSYRFLERFSKVAKTDPLIFNLSRYLLELALVNYKLLKYSPSNLASSALFLSLKMTKHPSAMDSLRLRVLLVIMLQIVTVATAASCVHVAEANAGAILVDYCVEIVIEMMKDVVMVATATTLGSSLILDTSLNLGKANFFFTATVSLTIVLIVFRRVLFDVPDCLFLVVCVFYHTSVHGGGVVNTVQGNISQYGTTAPIILAAAAIKPLPAVTNRDGGRFECQCSRLITFNFE
nr:ORF Ma52 [Stylonychia lemnae]